MMVYHKQIIIPLDKPFFTTPLFSSSNLQLSDNYKRIVIGKRGPYVEFGEDDIILNNLHIPTKEEWRLNDFDCYYIEYRSNCPSFVKVYLQKKMVNYADYKIGLYYISPKDLFNSNNYPIWVGEK